MRFVAGIMVIMVCLSGCARHKQDDITVPVMLDNELKQQFENAFRSVGYAKNLEYFKVAYTNNHAFTNVYKNTRGNKISYTAWIYDRSKRPVNISAHQAAKSCSASVCVYDKEERHNGQWMTIAKVGEQWQIIDHGTWKTNVSDPPKQRWIMSDNQLYSLWYVLYPLTSSLNWLFFLLSFPVVIIVYKRIRARFLILFLAGSTILLISCIPNEVYPQGAERSPMIGVIVEIMRDICYSLYIIGSTMCFLWFIRTRNTQQKF